MSTLTLPLALLDVLVQDEAGNAIPGAVVTVASRIGHAFTPYADEAATTPISATLTTGASGSVSWWLQRGPYEYTATVDGYVSPADAWDSDPFLPFELDVSVAATSITVAHNYGRRPAAVMAFDLTDTQVAVTVAVVDLDTITVTTAAPFTGKILVL